jgi:hypothetical protein
MKIIFKIYKILDNTHFTLPLNTSTLFNIKTKKKLARLLFFSFKIKLK